MLALAVAAVLAGCAGRDDGLAAAVESPQRTEAYRARYAAIGESDRFTLRFVKPAP